MHERAAQSLLSAFDDELSAVSSEVNALWTRHMTLTESERRCLYSLWDYRKRLQLLRVLLAIATPDQSVEPEPLAKLARSFADAIVAHGSASEDNLAAASGISLAVEPGGYTQTLNLNGAGGLSFAELVYSLCDIVGTPEFFVERLGATPELAGMTPDTWEDAYRVLMLAVDALFSCPRHDAQ
jgi:hypothetical protein